MNRPLLPVFSEIPDIPGLPGNPDIPAFPALGSELEAQVDVEVGLFRLGVVADRSAEGPEHSVVEVG